MGLFDFLNRHKYKILVAGGAVGAVMAINKVLSNYEKEWQNSSSRGFVHEVRKKEIHFENIINECNQICQRMCPKIIERLNELLDDTQLIKDLSSKSRSSDVNDKVEIWKALKVKILTRLLSEIYCTCILVCYMRVQMSIIGGQVFATNVSTSSAGPSSATVADLTNMKAYTKYIAILGSFYDQRFDCLIQPVEEVVEETLKGYGMDYKISLQDFKVILDKIKRSIAFYISGPTSKTRVFFFDIDKLTTEELSSACVDSGPLTSEDELMLRKMLAETNDIFESSDFKKVLEESIEVGYAVLLDTLLGAFIKMEGKLNSKDDHIDFSNPNSLQVPLVKILPQIRGNYAKRGEADQRVLVNNLLRLDVLNYFAANVYEAFCVPK